MTRRWFLVFFSLAALLAGTVPSSPGLVGTARASRLDPPWQVHDPITYSNLALFPVTAASQHDASGYLTLDEGLHTGEVEVTELGAAMIRRRPGGPPPDQAQINTLALLNHSKRPLILLAGEIVTGGKQDRVISKDRIVAPGGELPLDVFCVEPGRWRGASQAFGAQSLMAAPKVREKAAVAKNQQEVWQANDQVRSGVADNLATGAAGGGAPAARAQAELGRSSSYAQLENSEVFKRRIDDASGALQRDYERALRGALRGKDVVGVVVAINGEVVWADVFAESGLFARYWPKLLRSYAVEAMSGPVIEHAVAQRQTAEQFLHQAEGRQIIEVEPGEYRLVQIDHPRYSVFQLASLLEKSEPLLHFNKLRKEMHPQPKPAPLPMPRRDP